MTVVPGNVPKIHVDNGDGSRPKPQPTTVAISAIPAVTAAATVLVSLALGVPLSNLLSGAAVGAVTGWLHRFTMIRSPQLDALISALFGADWNRDSRVLIALDILARALVGAAVVLVFAELSGVLVGAGNGPPPDLFDLSVLFVLLLRFLVFLLCVALVGAGVMMLAEGVPLHILAKPAAAAVGKAIIKAAALAAAKQQKAGADHLWRAAQKGAVTAMLVAAAGAILGF